MEQMEPRFESMRVAEVTIDGQPHFCLVEQPKDRSQQPRFYSFCANRLSVQRVESKKLSNDIQIFKELLGEIVAYQVPITIQYFPKTQGVLDLALVCATSAEPSHPSYPIETILRTLKGRPRLLEQIRDQSNAPETTRLAQVFLTPQQEAEAPP
jgi:hypothetical protein